MLQIWHNLSLLCVKDISKMDSRQFDLWCRFLNALPNVDQHGYRQDLLNHNWVQVMLLTRANNCTQSEMFQYFKRLVNVYGREQVGKLLTLIEKQPIRRGAATALLADVRSSIHHALAQQI